MNARRCEWIARGFACGFACGLLLAAFCVLWFPGAAFARDARSVLVVFSDNRLLPANVEADQALRDTIADTEDRPVELYAEFLDHGRFSGDGYDDTTSRYLREKYAAHMPSVLVAGGTYATQFLVRKREELFPSVPIVYVGLTSDEVTKMAPLPADVVGVPVKFDYPAGLKAALRLHPGAKRLVIVTGGPSLWDRISEGELREAAAALSSRVTIEHLAGLPTRELLARLKSLPPATVVYTPGYFSDGAGRPFTPRESVEQMAKVAAAPIYGPFNTFLGTGIVGGVMPTYSRMGRDAGAIVNALLDGVAVGSLKLPPFTPSVLQIDWRQAKRWGITEDRLPVETVVQFKEPTFWEAYGNVALIAIGVMLLQSALIAALLYERRRQRRTAAALEASEQSMVLAARTARLSNWLWNVAPDSKANGTATAAMSASARPTEPTAVDFDQVLQITHPADREALHRAVRDAVQNDEELNVEYRVVRPDKVRWLMARGRAEQDGGRLRGVAIDITQQKLAELEAEQDRTALRHMTRVSLLGQLSASIAHQLNQPLASILSNAEAARKMLRHDDVDLEELRAICDDIVAEDNRAAQVIRQLGALYKRGEREVRQVDVNELIRETLDLLHTDLVTRQVTTGTDLAPALPTIEGERVQLQQVLMNLIVNASDAMLRAPEHARILSVRTASTGRGVRIDVGDRGHGIKREELDRIFEMFWTTKPGGMGIGLAICRSITTAHGGTLTAQNNSDGGATFSVTLPMETA